jgi:hypothetical protein
MRTAQAATRGGESGPKSHAGESSISPFCQERLAGLYARPSGLKSIFKQIQTVMLQVWEGGT